MKPWLLMDVDGPLSPFCASWFGDDTPAPGFQWHDLKPIGEPTYRVALNPGTGARLAGLTDRFDLAWATTWGTEANRLIAPLLGLPSDLPVVPLARPRFVTTRRSWKTESIARWVGSRPFAWFDDEINRATRHWLAGSGVGRHLALRVPCDVGLSSVEFDRLAAFASGLASSPSREPG